jgi:hypothetical protein
MSRPKSRRIGAGVVIGYRDGICTFTCHHDGCRAFTEPRSWRAGLRLARQHANDHDATEATYAGTPWGIPAHELPHHTTRRRRPLRRLAIAVVVLVLTALALPALLGSLTGHAAPAPPAAPSIAILPTTTPPTTTARPGPEGYLPTPAGPPATDPGGTWIPEPDPAPPAASSSAGGGR